MPIYIHCPHCEHPHVVPVARKGRVTRCRQCANAFVPTDEAREVATRTIHPHLAEFQAPLGQKVMQYNHKGELVQA